MSTTRALSLLTTLILVGCSTSPYVAKVSAFGEATTDLVKAHDALVAGRREDVVRSTRVQNYLGAPVMMLSPGCGNLRVGDCTLEPNPAFDPRPVGARITPATRVLRHDTRLKGVNNRTRAENGALSQQLPRRISDIGRVQYVPPQLYEADDVCREPFPARVEALATGAAPIDHVSEAQIFSALERYASALKAVSNAEDITAFNAASEKLATSIGALAALAAGPVGPAITAGLRIVSTSAGFMLERRRYEALRTSLSAACQPVRVLARAAGLQMSFLQRERYALNLRVLNLASNIDAPRRTLTRTAVLDLGLQAAASQASLAIDPKGAAQALADAHDALVVAVRDRQGQSLAAVKAIGKFADDAAAFRATVSGAAAGSATSASKP